VETEVASADPNQRDEIQPLGIQRPARREHLLFLGIAGSGDQQVNGAVGVGGVFAALRACDLGVEFARLEQDVKAISGFSLSGEASWGMRASIDHTSLWPTSPYGP
jgi:hypothetical protein